MKVILVGAPRSGKSTYARELRQQGIPTFCTDPLSLVKDPEQGVTYLPEGMAWSEASRFIADYWFVAPGPWCIEGIATVRALRKVTEDGRQRILDTCRIVRFTRQWRNAVTKPGQVAMAKAIDTVWSEVEPSFRAITEYR